MVGNPCNTNALIVTKSAPSIPTKNITAVTKLDETRARATLAEEINEDPESITQVAVWGNHSDTMVIDISEAQVDGHRATALVTDEWARGYLQDNVANRGGEII